MESRGDPKPGEVYTAWWSWGVQELIQRVGIFSLNVCYDTIESAGIWSGMLVWWGFLR